MRTTPAGTAWLVTTTQFSIDGTAARSRMTFSNTLRSVTKVRKPQSSARKRISSRRSMKLSGTGTAPSRCAANSAKAASMRLPVIKPTRSPLLHAELLQPVGDARHEARQIGVGDAIAAKERIVQRLIEKQRRPLAVQLGQPVGQRRHAQPIRLAHQDAPLVAEARDRPVLGEETLIAEADR